MEMFSFHDNKKTINEISNMFREGKLVVDEGYQRRSVWSEKDKIRLIETILLNLIIPQLFFWKAETDPETGESITHIVDGQQRIKAIDSFINNEFKLKSSYLLDDIIKKDYGDKFFKDLDSDTRRSFWNYQLMVIDIDPRASKDDIKTMFKRLNLTDYNLNDQEKRNSISGEFAMLARDLSNDVIWEEKRLFTNSDIKRMKDVEFCASLILLYKQGIIDQADQSALNQAYEEYQENYKDAEKDKEAICAAIDVLRCVLEREPIAKFLRRKAQLYTMFSSIFYMNREGIILKEENLRGLESFVELYVAFDNDMDLSECVNDTEKRLLELLKKYKLASSEGLNKHTNRMIRFNVMKTFMFDIAGKFYDEKISLKEKMEFYRKERKMTESIDL